MADSWFGSTALPSYGCLVPSEEELQLFPALTGKKVLDIGCGSGHSLNGAKNMEPKKYGALTCPPDSLKMPVPI